MTKSELRQKMQWHLAEKAKHDNNDELNRLYDALFRLSIWRESTFIGITVSTGHEINTSPIIEQGWRQNKNIAVPKCYPNKKELTFYVINRYDQLENIFYGLKEPDPEKSRIVTQSDLELIIVPGLSFDRYGYRIGFGGGYYDRYLAEHNVKTISLCYEFQLTDKLPSEKHDIPVDIIVTPEKTIYTGKAQTC